MTRKASHCRLKGPGVYNGINLMKPTHESLSVAWLCRFKWFLSSSHNRGGGEGRDFLSGTLCEKLELREIFIFNL